MPSKEFLDSDVHLGDNRLSDNTRYWSKSASTDSLLLFTISAL